MLGMQVILQALKIGVRKRNNMKKKYILFSNGTEFMWWQSKNCERCVKAVFYDEKNNRMPRYRCAVQEHIEFAAIDDGKGNKRDALATHSADCPFKQTERKHYPRKTKKDINQLELGL